MRGHRGASPTATPVLIGLALLMAVLGCTAPTISPQPNPSGQFGGTLRIGTTGDDPVSSVLDFTYVDPAAPNLSVLLRCCLARTLLTYPGATTTDGGTVLQPDLAVKMPDVSRDGLSWTFQLQHGIFYAPPYQDVEVTTYDIVRGAERAVRVWPETDVIAPMAFVAGAAEYKAGRASSISGLEAPDPYTLVVRLAYPYGALDWVADSAWAPIPEAVASGHDEDMDVYWVSTGPYMFETYPADKSATSAVLVRNPGWSRDTDTRRIAYVDRIEISHAGDDSAVYDRLERGDFDFLDVPNPADIATRYRADPALASRIKSSASETIFWLPMNLAVPPFDDPAVRRAVNLVIDRAELRDMILASRAEASGRPQPPGLISAHVFPDSMTAGLLVGYDPFGMADGGDDVPGARAAMSGSRYDTDSDGLCDAPACRGIRMPAVDNELAEAIRLALLRIGIEVEIVSADDYDMGVVTNRIPMQANTFGWGFSLTGSDLALLLRGGEGLVGEDGFTVNSSLVGARSVDLSAWGYEVTSVAGVDDLIDRCEREVSHLRARCWAELDQLVTETVVPWVPIFSFDWGSVASPRVADFSLDQTLGFPALDKVSLNVDAQ